MYPNLVTCNSDLVLFNCLSSAMDAGVMVEDVVVMILN
jgi:hypothetical protein